MFLRVPPSSALVHVLCLVGFILLLGTSQSLARLNPRRLRHSYTSFRSRHLRLEVRRLLSKQPVFTNDSANSTLDGGVFLLYNGIRAEKINTVPGDGLTMVLKSCHYLVYASFGLDHRAMRTTHAVQYTGTGPNLERSNVLPIGWWQNLVN